MVTAIKTSCKCSIILQVCSSLVKQQRRHENVSRPHHAFPQGIPAGYSKRLFGFGLKSMCKILLKITGAGSVQQQENLSQTLTEVRNISHAGVLYCFVLFTLYCFVLFAFFHAVSWTIGVPCKESMCDDFIMSFHVDSFC